MVGEESFHHVYAERIIRCVIYESKMCHKTLLYCISNHSDLIVGQFQQLLIVSNMQGIKLFKDAL